MDSLTPQAICLPVPISESQCFVVSKRVVSCLGLVGEFRNSKLSLTLELAVESEVLSILLLESFVL